MTTAIEADLGWLQKITGVQAEALELTEPFMDLIGRFAHLPGTVALMSGGDRDCARYHILGLYPWLTLSGQRTRTFLASGEQQVTLDLDPFTALRQVLQYCAWPQKDASLPLSCGLLGYFAYDLKDCLEQFPRTSVDDLGLPLMYLAAPTLLVIHDRQTEASTLLVVRRDGDEAVIGAELARFTETLAAPGKREPKPQTVGQCRSAFSRSEYMAAVDAIRNYIVEGDVYQVNMSQRFQASFTGDPFDCFVSMYDANPAPFFAYINAGDHQIVSTSPERFIELRNGKVETRPIKGTRPRGRTPEEDAALRTELQESLKEDAELSMIVDLLRNDIGKVCRVGSVQVTEHKRVEAYQNVFHLVSTVQGHLDFGMDAVDLLRATFPGGSITGCPKIRAMEVIDELEPVRRHIYTGSIGYLGFDGGMDLSIAIRTATFSAGKVVFSVGGGVVIDSDPASEYEETLHKGRTLMNALDAAGDNRQRLDSVWHDGAFKPAGAAMVPFDSEGLAYGFGFFETLRVQNGRPILLDAHLQRFEKAWREFFRRKPPDVTWADIIARLIEKNRLATVPAAVKLMAAAGRPGEAPTLFVSARPYTLRPVLNRQPGLALRTFPHPRYSHLASHKTLNYMYYKLAGDWAKQQGADEALILDVDAAVSETNTASLCCIYGKTACFPKSAHALPGTMAAEVRRLLALWGFKVEDRRLTVENLRTADQVLVANSLMGVVPVISLDGEKLPTDTALSTRLNRAVFENADQG